MEGMLQDVRYAVRTLRRAPAFTAVAVATLALGIGANTAMYSVVRAVLLRPVSAHEPDRLVHVYESNAGRGLPLSATSIADYAAWKEQARTLDLAAFIRVSRSSSVSGEAQRYNAIAATASFLPVLGRAVQTGRWFREEEEVPGLHRVTVLGDRLWKRQFAQDPAIAGRSLMLDGEPYTIVGVAPPDLAAPFAPDLWVPLLAKPRDGDPNASRSNRFLQVVGRLRPGFMLSQANAELAALAGDVERRFPSSNSGWTAGAQPLVHWLVPRDIRTALGVLLAAVGIVLLIACANVANLLLARSEGRRKEIAIRAALGAGASRIARQLLTESLLLSLGGGLLGVVLGSTIVNAAARSLEDIVPRGESIAIDGSVLAFAAAASILTGLLFGLAPVLQLGRRWGLDALHQAGRASQPSSRGRVRSVLVTAQVSLATLLLVGAALLMQSFARLQRVPTGLNAESVLTASIPLPGDRYFPGDRYAALLARLNESLRNSAGVTAAGTSIAIPLGPGSHMKGPLAADASAQPVTAEWRSADAGFFAALGIPLLRGRLFDAHDSRPVYVLSQAGARSIFGDRDPIGRTISVRGASGEVIGVVGDIRMRSLGDPPDRVVYMPLGQGGFFGVFSVFVRAAGPPQTVAGILRERLREIDPTLPAFDVRSMHEWVDQRAAPARIRTWVLAGLAGVALLLGMIGIYGVLGYLASLRRHEFGVRLALGATPADILRMVLAGGLGLAVAGVAAGLAAAAVLTRALDTLLFGVRSRDPLTFAGVAVVLLLAAAVACVVPARRAASADPIVTLRGE